MEAKYESKTTGVGLCKPSVGGRAAVGTWPGWDPVSLGSGAFPGSPARAHGQDLVTMNSLLWLHETPTVRVILMDILL